MIKSTLTFLGLGGIAYAFYNYYNKQLALALDWDFKVKGFKIRKLTKKSANLDLVISILNKSSFELTVNDYDISILYEGQEIGTAQNDVPFKVAGDSWFDVPTNVNIVFDSAKGVLDDFALNVLTQKPILIDVKGQLNVEFGNIKKKVVLNLKDKSITENLAQDIGVSKPLSKIKGVLNEIGLEI